MEHIEYLEQLKVRGDLNSIVNHLRLSVYDYELHSMTGQVVILRKGEELNRFQLNHFDAVSICEGLCDALIGAVTLQGDDYEAWKEQEIIEDSE